MTVTDCVTSVLQSSIDALPFMPNCLNDIIWATVDHIKQWAGTHNPMACQGSPSHTFQFVSLASPAMPCISAPLPLPIAMLMLSCGDIVFDVDDIVLDVDDIVYC